MAPARRRPPSQHRQPGYSASGSSTARHPAGALLARDRDLARGRGPAPPRPPARRAPPRRAQGDGPASVAQLASPSHSARIAPTCSRHPRGGSGRRSRSPAAAGSRAARRPVRRPRAAAPCRSRPRAPASAARPRAALGDPPALGGAGGVGLGRRISPGRRGLRPLTRAREGGLIGGDDVVGGPRLQPASTRKPTGRSSALATKSRNLSQTSLIFWWPVKGPVSMIAIREKRSGCSTRAAGRSARPSRGRPRSRRGGRAPRSAPTSGRRDGRSSTSRDRWACRSGRSPRSRGRCSGSQRRGPADHIAPGERPGRLPVEEDDRLALPLVEIGEPHSVDLRDSSTRRGSRAAPASPHPVCDNRLHGIGAKSVLESIRIGIPNFADQLCATLPRLL